MIYLVMGILIVAFSALYFNEIYVRQRTEKELRNKVKECNEWSERWHKKVREADDLRRKLAEANDLIKTIERDSEDDLKNY